MKVTNATAIVTGGSSGLGRATAEALTAAGAKVVILDLSTSGGREVARDLGGDTVFVDADVRREQEVGRAIDAAMQLGPLRIVVNCAGIGSGTRTVNRDGIPHGLDEFMQTIQVNLVGTFNVCRLAAAAMMTSTPLDDDERGVMVTTASVAAYEGQVGQVAYAASKGGIASMTLPMARDLAAAAIRVVTVSPGLFRTPLFATLSPEAMAKLEAQVPHPSRLGEPHEYASLVVHIAENPMINGEVIRLDGALRMAAT